MSDRFGRAPRKARRILAGVGVENTIVLNRRVRSWKRLGRVVMAEQKSRCDMHAVTAKILMRAAHARGIDWRRPDCHRMIVWYTTVKNGDLIPGSIGASEGY